MIHYKYYFKNNFRKTVQFYVDRMRKFIDTDSTTMI